jgi:methyl-accepting chemotaxis protein
METIHFPEDQRPPWAVHPVLALGNFDGLHRGHLKIIERVRRGALEHGGTPMAMTFDPVTRSTNARNTFVGTTQTSIMNASSLSETGAEGYFLLGGSAIDLSNQLLTSAQTALQADFDARASTAQKDFALYGSAAIIGIILALGLAVFISATITRPMTHLAEVADRMSLGELDVEIDVDGSNEIGQLAESLRRMQSSLRSAIERLRQRRAAA